MRTMRHPALSGRRGIRKLAVPVATVASVAALGLGILAGAAPAASAAGKIGGSLTVWAEWTSTEQTAFQKAYAPFEKESGVTINYAGKGSNMDTALDAAVAGGKPPDVAFVPDPGTLRTLAGQGKLQPLSGVLGSEVHNYGGAWNSLASSNGKLYGVWFKAANKNTIWYNPAEFATAGIKGTPRTWESLVSDANNLRAAGVTPLSLCTDIGWPVADLWQNVYLKTAGAADYNKLAAHQIKWTNPTVTRAFDTLRELVGNAANLAGGVSGSLANKYPDCVDKVFPKPGTSPTAAMVIEGDFVVSEVTGNSANYYPGTKGKGGAKCSTDASATPCYNFFAFPAPKADARNASALQGAGDVGMMLNATPQAKAFMKYIASGKPAGIWAHIGGFTSPNKQVSLKDYPDAVTRADAKQLVDATSFVFSLDDLQGTWEPQMWTDMLNFVKNPSNSNIKTIEHTMEKQATAAMSKKK